MGSEDEKRIGWSEGALASVAKKDSSLEEDEAAPGVAVAAVVEVVETGVVVAVEASSSPASLSESRRRATWSRLSFGSWCKLK